MAGPAVIFREIHRVRSYLASLQEQLDRMPIQRKARQAKLNKAEQQFKDEEDGIKKLKVKISETEKTLKSKEAMIERYQQQTTTVSSKKEYDALRLEIAHTKDVCAKLEEEILTAMGECDERVARLPTLEKELQATRESVAKFLADSAAREADLQGQRVDATKMLKEVEPKVPKDLVEQYRRTVNSMGHDGFAAVREGACTACNTVIYRHMQLELENENFVVCKSCGRILYIKEGEKAGLLDEPREAED